MVIEHRLDPLLPLGAQMRERVTAPDPGAQVENVIWWDPRLRQAADQQKLPQMAGVSPIGLRALLRTPQPARLRRLGQVHPSADPLELLGHEPPPRRCLQRNLEIPPGEPLEELADRSAVCRHHPPARDLTARKLDPLRGDLRPVLIKPHHDRQPPSRLPSPARRSTLQLPPGLRREQRPARPIAYLGPRSVPPIRMAGRAGGYRARLLVPFDAGVPTTFKAGSRAS